MLYAVDWREQYRQKRDQLRAELERDRTPGERRFAGEVRTQRARYNSLPSAEKKALYEIEVFRAFAKVAPSQVEADSERSVNPPQPDICCTIHGSLYYFELGEITEVARNLARAIKYDEPRGVAFEQDRPFACILKEKAKKNYVTSGAPVDLLLYYRSQYPPWKRYFDEMVSANTHLLQAALKQNAGPFDRLWVFDFWKHRILWSG
jgi:hypothetical protein